MKCKYCGRQLPEGSLFCIYCGKPVEERPEEFAEPVNISPSTEENTEPEEKTDAENKPEETASDNTEPAETPAEEETPASDQPEESQEESQEEAEEKPEAAEEETAAAEQPTEQEEAADDKEPEKEQPAAAEKGKAAGNAFVSWLKEEGKAILSVFRHPLTSDAEPAGLIVPASIFIHAFYLYETGSGLFYEAMKTISDSIGSLIMSMYGLGGFSRSDIHTLLNQYGYSYWSTFGWAVLLTAALLGIIMLSAYFEEDEPQFITLWHKASRTMLIPELCILAAAITAIFSYPAALLITLFALSFLLVYLITSLNSGRMNTYCKAILIAVTILLIAVITIGGTWTSLSHALTRIMNSVTSSNIWG
jgi:hypothetical protein